MAHPSVVINNVTYANCPQVSIPKSGGGIADFFDASETDVIPANVLGGKKFIGASGEDVGTMVDNGATGGTISTKSGTVTIPAGYTSGGTVSLQSSAVTDCTSGNILQGKTILGIQGNLSMPSISQDSTTKVLSIS